MPEKTMEVCTVCELPLKDCICCGCSHVCPRDQGEPYCPICLPEPDSAVQEPCAKADSSGKVER